jgi:hypothetical protein
MATVRQMAELYLRGSLTNVTMKNLKPEEAKFAEEIMIQVADHPDMRKHKHHVKRLLSETIRADYKSDPSTAEQEYQIAIWRGVVNLFFHKQYIFKCSVCDATQRVVKTTGKLKPIDQAYIPCPVCESLIVSEHGDDRTIIKQTTFKEIYKDFQLDPPQCFSTIIAYPGGGATKEELDGLLSNGEITEEVYERKLGQFRYAEPYKIINDTSQMVKFFGEFVWGYFKQQLRENKRAEQTKKQTEIIGKADEVIVQEIISSATRLKVPLVFCSLTQPESGWWNLGVQTNQTPPEFTFDILPTFKKATDLGIDIQVTQSGIRVEHKSDCAQIRGSVTQAQHIKVMDNNYQSIDNEESTANFSVEQVTYKTVGGCKMSVLDDVGRIDMQDMLNTIYESLPDGDCRKVFQILKQEGEWYEDFKRLYNFTGEPKQAHIAKYLKTTTRIVKNHIAYIKMACLSHQLGP